MASATRSALTKVVKRPSSAALAAASSSFEPQDDTIATRWPGRHDLAAGTTVRLDWNPEDTHWFDAATNLRRDDVAPG